MFTTSRKLHQDVTTASVTGELPTAALLAGVNRKDGGSTAHVSQEELGFNVMRFGWAGCMDAPDHLPVGGCRAVYIDPAVGGMGFEGIAAVNAIRGSR